MNYRALLSVLFLSAYTGCVLACTSAIVSREASANGNMLLWKHRDTSHGNNYVDTVMCPDRRFDYIALFNSSDTAKREAWAGVNRSGFAIFNTVAGNLPENNKDWADREGYVMSQALANCVLVSDFERLLESMPKPMGIRANFGVADAYGNGAYFEADDYHWHRFDLSPDSASVLIRSNFSCSVPDSGGYGYERYYNAAAVLLPLAEASAITPEVMTDSLSREYIYAKVGDVCSNSKAARIADRNFIPRPSSSASVVIELTPDGPVMWTILGYPPASYTLGATIDCVPAELKRDAATGKNNLASEAARLKNKIITNGKINVKTAKEISRHMKCRSLDNYKAFRKKVQSTNRK